MRVAIFSDSHGDDLNLRWLMEQVMKRGRVDEYIHCGDGAGDFLRMENFMRISSPNAVCYGVRGNCDFGMHDVPDKRVLTLGGVNTLLTHGHLFGVKSSFQHLAAAAREAGCTLALFGHTHQPAMEMVGSVLLLNPGTATQGRAALLDIDDAGRLRPQLLSF